MSDWSTMASLVVYFTFHVAWSWTSVYHWYVCVRATVRVLAGSGWCCTSLYSSALMKWCQLSCIVQGKIWATANIDWLNLKQQKINWFHLFACWKQLNWKRYRLWLFHACKPRDQICSCSSFFVFKVKWKIVTRFTLCSFFYSFCAFWTWNVRTFLGDKWTVCDDI
jgi:hypothetical protein